VFVVESFGGSDLKAICLVRPLGRGVPKTSHTFDAYP
jgi:hypothetical protein